jgi:hypothetical protein
MLEVTYRKHRIRASSYKRKYLGVWVPQAHIMCEASPGERVLTQGRGFWFFFSQRAADDYAREMAMRWIDARWVDAGHEDTA